MKISGEKPVGLESYLQKVENKEELDPKANRTSGETTVKEKVQISEKAREIKEVKEVLETIPDIRQDKVDRVKTTLENGTYDVEGKKIAGKMIEETLIDLLL